MFAVEFIYNRTCLILVELSEFSCQKALSTPLIYRTNIFDIEDYINASPRIPNASGESRAVLSLGLISAFLRLTSEAPLRGMISPDLGHLGSHITTFTKSQLTSETA